MQWDAASGTLRYCGPLGSTLPPPDLGSTRIQPTESASGPWEPAPGEAATTAASRRGRPRSAEARPPAMRRPKAAARAARAGKGRAAAKAAPAKAAASRQHHLKTESVSARTAVVYESWRRRAVRFHGRALPADLGKLDGILGAFVTELYIDGEAVSSGRVMLAAVAFSLNLSFGATASCLQLAGQGDDGLAAARAVVLMQDGYFRPSDELNIRRADIADVSARGPLAITIAPALARSPDEKGQAKPPAKTGEYDDTVLIHDQVSVAAGRAYLRKLMETLLAAAGAAGSSKLFPNLALANFEHLFGSAAADAGLSELRLSPRMLRRGGPSVGALGRRRSLAEVQGPGRWGAKASVKNYAKGGRVLRQTRKMTDQQRRR
ncbi:unnamed protein product, partial [Prorocentrum cordatum]